MFPDDSIQCIITPSPWWEITDGKKPILRLDHIHPVGSHYLSYELSDYTLSDNAMEIMDDFFYWLIWGGVPEDSLIPDYRKEIESIFEY